MSSGTLGRTNTGQRVITKKAIPVWAIILIIVLVIIAIVVPIIIWFLMRRSRKGGSGDTCSATTDCANGLTCNGTVCGVPICAKPDKPKFLKYTETINLPGWDVELNWQKVNNADYYLIFVGETETFNPIEESLFVGVTDTNMFIFEQIPPLTNVFIKIAAANQNCGIGPFSDAKEIDTSPII